MDANSERLMPQQIRSREDAFAQLRADVDFLGRVLGSVLIRVEGQAFFERVEQVRNVSKALRAKPDDSHLRQQLTNLLAGLSVEEAERLLRAFTVYFQLVNAAESIQRVRVNRWREGQATRDTPRKESVAAAVKALKDEGWSKEEVRRFLADLDIQLTLTAHPTEVKRYTIRLKLERIATALRQLSERDLAPPARVNIEKTIHAEVMTLWQTREVSAEKPSVLDEVKSALYYFPSSLLDSIPRLMTDMEEALESYFPADAPGNPTPLPPVIKFRSWIGGDRDGNPYVSPEVMTEAYRLQQEVAMRQHFADVDLLVQRLSQWQERITLSGQFIHDLADLEAKAGKPTRFDEQPYRQKLFHMNRGLRQVAGELAQAEEDPYKDDHHNDGEEAYDAEQYLRDLSLLDTSLQRNQEAGVAEAFVRPIYYRGAAFGFHLAALDIREHSGKHEHAVADLLNYAGVTADYIALEEEAKIALLEQEISSKRPLAPASAALADETKRALSFLNIFQQMQARFGRAATGSYIVSMTAGVSDVLEVLLLAKQVGLREIDPVPLFETVDDLNRAPEVLTRLFEMPAYLAHIQHRGIQEVMIGYSDSNKDAGFVAANWALYQAQEGIAAVCKKHGVRLRLFHGRGTSIGRGGGPAGRSILAQPPGSLGGRMRITEQGEALSERYSDPDLAHRHLEQVAHAFILSSARDARDAAPPVPERYREVMQTAAQKARQHYRNLLEDEGFLDVYHTVTPIEEISRLHIGSRPTRRKGTRSLDSLRAIPWVFSWTQCRANLPGWYGIGTGLGDLDTALLQEMYAHWPFFNTVIDFAQMSLAKADMGVFSSYLSLVPNHLRTAFWDTIASEHKRSVRVVEAITGKPLLDNDPTLQRAIELRNPYVDPLSYLQVELLKRLREGDVQTSREQEKLEYAVLVSLLGISAGMRNTG